MKKLRGSLPSGFTERPAPKTRPPQDQDLLEVVDADLGLGLTLRNGDGTPKREMLPGDLERGLSEEDRLRALDRIVEAARAYC